MDNALRSVRLHSGHVLTVWDDGTMSNGKARLRYVFTNVNVHTRYAPKPVGVLFCGADYGVSPMHATDSDAALLALLSFLSLRPGDTDREYFAEYTPAQLAWTQSSACESLSCDISVAEEAGGCVCGYLWDNADDWDKEGGCADRPTVATYKVIDHGEDGSQYFPGCGAGAFDHVATGMGDTAEEALDDALESMARQEHTVSPLQERIMREDWLDKPSNKSAHDSLDAHEDCDSFGCDWYHYVSVQYNVRGEP